MEKDSNKDIILVSNDDGIHSLGIIALYEALSSLGEVYVVAPDREQSAVSHSLTLHRPLRVDNIGTRKYAVDGTPTDCISLAVGSILPKKPKIIVSGINRGGNLGEDVSYSGTVSAAKEGVLLGIPSIALSLIAGTGVGKIVTEDLTHDFDYRNAAEFAKKLVSYVMGNSLPKQTLLNVNVPNVTDLKGYKITKQGSRTFGDTVIEKTDPRGRKYYWIAGDIEDWEGGEDADYHAIENGFVSITPIHLDMTNHSAIKKLKDWKI